MKRYRRSNEPTPLGPTGSKDAAMALGLSSGTRILGEMGFRDQFNAESMEGCVIHPTVIAAIRGIFTMSSACTFDLQSTLWHFIQQSTTVL
jgi:hypothetical protein